MKKFLLFLIVFILAFPQTTFAAESYIEVDPLAYSSYCRGEDFTIKGDTNLASFTLGLYPPKVEGFYSIAKYIMTCFSDELSEGITIPIGTNTIEWPEGVWQVILQNGSVRTVVDIPIYNEPVYDRKIMVCEYSDNTLMDISTYFCRGAFFGETIAFETKEGFCYEIFTWDNLSPTDAGDATVYVAEFKDDILTTIKAYSGTLDPSSEMIVLNISPTECIKIFYWNDLLNPIK